MKFFKSDSRPSEKTPLAPLAPASASSSSNNNNNTSGADALKDVASKVFTKENMQKAGEVAKQKAQELKREANNGGLSMRLLALFGGTAMLITSGLELFPYILTLNIIGAFIHIYCMLLGIMVIVLEGKVLLAKNWLKKLHKYALFLQFVWGRGGLYFIAGTLQLSQGDIMNLVCGAFMCFVGALFIFVGQQTAKKLQVLRKSLYSEQTLKSRFQEADMDGTGSLDLNQFRILTHSLGMDMTRRETEAAFMHIHQGDGKLSYEEFQAWWNHSGADDEVIDESSAPFLSSV